MPGIRLQRVNYFERLGREKEWTLEDLDLGPVNLLVGKNATGKTRCLNTIWNLAQMFVPETGVRTQNAGYDLLFDNEGQPLRYILHVDEGKVRKEELYLNGALLLRRGLGGEGEIFAQVEGRPLRLKPPENEIAAVARRDSLQHPFLDPLHLWAQQVRHYTFGTQLGKDHIAMPVNGNLQPNDRDPAQVVGIFRTGVRDLGTAFVDAVKRDMATMHYELDSIEANPPGNMRVLVGGSPADVLALGIRERGVSGVIEQNEISQGMFRALSILIQVNYSQMARRANCILIDDIGEGLDFDRSTQLIEMLRTKAHNASFQLVMTTNDQFVMNHIPLEEWSVLQRQGSKVKARNARNSRSAFDYFRFVGMTNFTFFEMDFVNGPPKGMIDAPHE